MSGSENVSWREAERSGITKKHSCSFQVFTKQYEEQIKIHLNLQHVLCLRDNN